jgi:hypothetical protein
MVVGWPDCALAGWGLRMWCGRTGPPALTVKEGGRGTPRWQTRAPERLQDRVRPDGPYGGTPGKRSFRWLLSALRELRLGVFGPVARPAMGQPVERRSRQAVVRQKGGPLRPVPVAGERNGGLLYRSLITS